MILAKPNLLIQINLFNLILVFSLNKFLFIYFYLSWVELETAPLSRSSEIKKDSLEPVSETQKKA
jgi:hypothetical protein